MEMMMTKLAQKRDLRRFLKLAKSLTLENHACAQKLTIKKIESTKLKTERVTKCDYISSSREILRLDLTAVTYSAQKLRKRSRKWIQFKLSDL